MRLHGFRLVLETLEPLPKDRKCFRMVNGVLVERTIQDVIPALKTNAEGLKQVLDELVKQYKAKQTEMDEWKVSRHLYITVSWGETDTVWSLGDTISCCCRRELPFSPPINLECPLHYASRDAYADNFQFRRGKTTSKWYNSESTLLSLRQGFGICTIQRAAE